MFDTENTCMNLYQAFEDKISRKKGFFETAIFKY